MAIATGHPAKYDRPMSRPAPRLYVTAPLHAGAEIALEKAQAHYLSNVLRLGAGAEVRLFNGRDGEWRTVIADAGKRGATLSAEAMIRPQAAPATLVLAFAPLKKDAMDFLVAKATELGATELRPILTERTETRRVNLERIGAQLIEAAEQCERLDVPTVSEPEPLAGFLAGWAADRPLWCGDETGRGQPFAAALQEFRGPEGPHGILIGPEGGFTEGELARLAGLAFARRIDLGPRILRADTAALAALAYWQALLGDPHRLNQ
jgi:16S rRNA (uracil1498-N3)-methyltransferase